VVRLMRLGGRRDGREPDRQPCRQTDDRGVQHVAGEWPAAAYQQPDADQQRHVGQDIQRIRG
jgi:hypothetical protein